MFAIKAYHEQEETIHSVQTGLPNFLSAFPASTHNNALGSTSNSNPFSTSKSRALCFFILMIPVLLHGQVLIHLESLPASTPDSADIFLAGTINNWNPADTSFQFEIRPDSGYWLNIKEGNGMMEFKFTRGSWATVEGNENGSYLPNRTFEFASADTLLLGIQSWEDLDGGGGSENSSANKQVQVWDEAMYIPQLDRERRIWIYLPQDYESSEKFYPVLYLQDGQNVFDVATSFAGEWKVDETLTRLENEGKESAIVIAIDNGASYRIDEYSPFINPDYGGGEGNAYLDFITETLIPRIDSNFRTKKGPEYTGIMGSSMGGLISHYAYFRNPEIFGRIGVFSPSYWFSDEYFSYSSSQGLHGSPRIFLLAGSEETTIADMTEEMYTRLIQEGFTEEHIRKSIIPGGTHSEGFWASQFENAFLWLFYPDELSNMHPRASHKVRLFPNPASETITITGQGELTISLYNSMGTLLQQSEANTRCEIPLDDAHTSLVFVVVKNEGRIYSSPILIK